MTVADSELLFPRSYIPAEIQSRVGNDIEIRPLAISDHSRGHFDLLSVLTAAPAVSAEEYAARFQFLQSCLNTYYTVVFVNKANDELVAVGSIIVERKFTHGLGLVGHIEDIAVSKKMQGRKLGLHLINTLEEIGRSTGCYKIILDCSKDNIPFYEKCGFKHKEYEMVLYLDEVPKQAPASRL